MSRQRFCTALGFALLCAVQVLVALEFSIINVALPTIRYSLGIDSSLLQWLLSGYAIVLGSSLLFGGRLADFVGARRSLIAGLTAFTVAAGLAAVARTLFWLLLARSLQGLSAAIATPSALALLTRLSEGPRRERALAWWGASASVGFALGVVSGGLIVQVAGWRFIFVACAALSAAITFGILAWIPAVHGEPRVRPDLIGSLLLALGSGTAVTALTLIGSGGADGRILVALAAGSLLLMALFGAHQRRTPDVLFPTGLFRRPQVWKANAAGFAAAAAGGGMVYFVSDFMQSNLHWERAWIGLALVPDAMAAALGARSAIQMVRHWGLLFAAQAGLLAIATGMLVLAFVPSPLIVAIAMIIAGTCLVGFGLVLVSVVATIGATRELEASEHGVSAGLLTATQQWGVAVGLAVLVSAATLANPFHHGHREPIRSALLAGSAIAALALVGSATTVFLNAAPPAGGRG